MSISETTSDTTETPAPRGKTLRWLLLMLGAFALLVALLPTLVAKTPLRGWLVGAATADLNGRVVVGDARFGWFGAQAIDDITVYDDQEETVVRIESVTIENGLLKLILDSAHVGTVRINRPDLHVVVTEEFNNIERLLHDLVKLDEEVEKIEASNSPFTVTVNIVDARVELVDAVNTETWLIDEVNAECVVGGKSAGDIDVKLTARVPNGADAASEDAATLKLALSQTPSSESPESGRVSMRVQSERLPLQLVGAALIRLAPGIELTGLAGVDLACAWSYADNAPLSLSIQGQVTAEGATLGGPWFAEGEQITLARVTAPCQFTLDENGIRIEQLTVQCGDLGQFVASGAMTRSGDIWQPVAESPLECSAIIDFAELANMIPRTVGLYDGMSLATGNLELRASGGQDAEGTILNAMLKTGDVVAITPDGQTVSWEQPASLTLTARQTRVDASDLVKVVLEKVDFRSDFAQIEAKGTPASMTADAHLDLALLADHLRQFVDLDDTEMAGRVAAHLEWQLGGQQANASVDAKVNDLVFGVAGQPPLVEPTLNITASLTGQAADNTLRRVDEASFQLVAREDNLTVTLSEPIEVAAGRWPVAITAAGDIGRWLSRGRPWLGADVITDISGGVALGANAEWTPTGATISDAQMRLSNVRGDLFGVTLDEPGAQLDLAAVWERGQDAVELRNVVLRSSAVGLSSARLTLAGSSLGTFRGDGQVLFAADLARLTPVVGESTNAFDPNTGNADVGGLVPVRGSEHPLAAPLPPGTKTATGRVNGSLTFTPTDIGTSMVIGATVENLVVTSASGSTWQEPTVNANLTVRFDTKDNAVVIDALGVAARAIAVEASGRVDRPDADCFVDVSGNLKYDWATLRPALAAYLPEEVQISGNESRPFTLKGPLAPSAVAAESMTAVSTGTSGTTTLPTGADTSGPLGALTAQTSIGWQQAMIFGFQLETANLPIALEGGMLQMARSDVVVTSGGLIDFGGTLRISPQPWEVYVPSGRVADHIDITPEMCSQGLMYISPIFAGVTKASGEFSIDIKQLQLPLDAPQQGQLSGEVTVHTVELSPGPLIQELSVLFANRGDIRLKKESVVPFEMHEGRIYHRDLVLQFPDFEIRMTGSVGLDGTLDMTAEMPIPTKWIGGNVLGDFLKGRMIEVPIGGTVERPQIDYRRLEELSASFFRDSATDKVESEIGRQLNRFFSPPR